MKRGAANGPKMKALGRRFAELLGLHEFHGRHVATSTLHRLWEWVTTYSPSGDLTAVAPSDLAEDLLWTGDPGKLFEALIAERWVDERDGRRGVHDWPAHCEHFVHIKLARARLFFWDGTAPSFTRMQAAERAEAAAWYAANAAPEQGKGAVRSASARRARGKRSRSARVAHQMRPSHALPCLEEKRREEQELDIETGALHERYTSAPTSEPEAAAVEELRLELDPEADAEPPAEPARSKPRPRGSLARKRAKQPALLPVQEVLPSEPTARREALLHEIQRYGAAPRYRAERREIELWLDANLPKVEAWAEGNGKPLKYTVHAFWSRYCDEGKRPFRADVENERKLEQIREHKRLHGIPEHQNEEPDA